jgi:hypothetical protein
VESRCEYAHGLGGEIYPHSTWEFPTPRQRAEFWPRIARYLRKEYTYYLFCEIALAVSIRMVQPFVVVNVDRPRLRSLKANHQ